MKAFVSYSHADRKLERKFREHLYPLEQKFGMTVFDDNSILPGKEWQRDIWSQFESSDLVFALISSAFIKSDFCFRKEFARAIAKHHRRQVVVIPVILRACIWRSIPDIAKIQALPDEGEPVVGGKFRSQDWAFANVVNGINKLLTELVHKQRPSQNRKSGAHKQSPSQKRKSSRTPPKPVPNNYLSTHFKAVFFDLDGTLVRGRRGHDNFRYSWQLVWEHLKYDEKTRKEYHQQYLYHEIDYGKWCDIARDAFRERGLKKADFAEIARKVRLTKNCKESLAILKSRGVICVIVSGGIDTFLEAVFPDYFEYFDYVYINKFRYDEAGVLEAIEKTPYDFEGKYAAIQSVCKRHNLKLSDCVFVGEGRNDIDAARALSQKGGLTIGYPSNVVVDYVAIDLWKDRLDAILDVMFDV